MANAMAIPEALIQTLRAAASRASDLSRGGFALVFAGDPGAPDSPTLRAAAGLPSAELARAVAAELADRIDEVVAHGTAISVAAPAPAASQGQAGVSVLPLEVQGRVRGAVAVGNPTPPEARQTQSLGQLTSTLALHLDHLHLSVENEALRERLTQAPPADPEAAAGGEQDPDELLRLSEALFAQDVELLRRDEKLAKIEKLKNDFIEKMSRELRTPLNNIIEAIISVISSESDRLGDTSLQALRNALDEGTAFLRTLQNILDLWRIKQNELPVEIQEVNFEEVVEEAIFSVQDTLGSKPVTIEKDFAQPLPKLRTDLAKINLILFQLLDNAAKFTDRGTITISPRIEGSELVCRIEDTGIGICPDDQELIFDEFFQVDDMNSTRYRGAGLGLALLRDLLVLLGGEILVQSEAGKGTTVTFRLPVQTL